MVGKKMTTYADEDLLRSAKILAAKRDGKIYEVFEDALRRHLAEADGADALSAKAVSGAVLADLGEVARMAVGRSRKQMERIKKARRDKNTDRFVVTRTRSGMIVGDVLKKSAGRSVPKTRAHTRSVPATKVSRENGRQPRPKVPLLPGGKDSTLGERFEGELYHP